MLDLNIQLYSNRKISILALCTSGKVQLISSTTKYGSEGDGGFGRKCVSDCIRKDYGDYSSYCYTDTKTYSYGGECIPCSGEGHLFMK